MLCGQGEGGHIAFSHADKHTNLTVSHGFLKAVVSEISRLFFADSLAVRAVACGAGFFENFCASFLVAGHFSHLGRDVRALVGWKAELVRFLWCIANATRT